MRKKKHYLLEILPYFRQTTGELFLGSISGIIKNTTVVLPAVLLGRAIDVTLAFDKGLASLAATLGALTVKTLNLSL